jgi:hypothetical protein
MYVDDTSIVNIGKDINELQNITSDNTGLVQQYFETKTHYILFQTKQRRQESKLKILIKNRKIVKVHSTNFLGVIIESNLS